MVAISDKIGMRSLAQKVLISGVTELQSVPTIMSVLL